MKISQTRGAGIRATPGPVCAADIVVRELQFDCHIEGIDKCENSAGAARGWIRGTVGRRSHEVLRGKLKPADRRKCANISASFEARAYADSGPVHEARRGEIRRARMARQNTCSSTSRRLLAFYGYRCASLSLTPSTGRGRRSPPPDRWARADAVRSCQTSNREPRRPGCQPFAFLPDMEICAGPSAGVSRKRWGSHVLVGTSAQDV